MPKLFYKPQGLSCALRLLWIMICILMGATIYLMIKINKMDLMMYDLQQRVHTLQIPVHTIHTPYHHFTLSI